MTSSISRERSRRWRHPVRFYPGRTGGSACQGRAWGPRSWSSVQAFRFFGAARSVWVPALSERPRRLDRDAFLCASRRGLPLLDGPQKIRASPYSLVDPRRFASAVFRQSRSENGNSCAAALPKMGAKARLSFCICFLCPGTFYRLVTLRTLRQPTARGTRGVEKNRKIEATEAQERGLSLGVCGYEQLIMRSLRRFCLPAERSASASCHG